MSETPAKPVSHRLHFGLLGIGLLVLVTAVLLAMVHEARQQGIAVTELQRLGCGVGYAGSGSSLLERLRKLLGEREPSNVVTLYATSPQVTDADLAHLHALARIQFLSLNGSQVTDAGLIHLKGLKQLQSCQLCNTRVTDAGLAHLEGLTQLSVLWLDGTQTTDAGLEHLRGLGQLEEVNLVRSPTTEAEERRLKTALPQAKIIRLFK